jgi:integral membrane protein
MLKPALLRYRVITYIVGTLLIVLTYGTIQKYTGGDDTIVSIVGRLHGFLYMVFLVITAMLARRARWTFGYTILVMLAGTVPVFSFVAERFVTRKIQAAIAARESAAAEVSSAAS